MTISIVSGPHQYIDRRTGQVRDEILYADRVVTALFGRRRERPGVLFHLLTSRRFSGLLGFLNYDCLISRRMGGIQGFARRAGIDLSECLDPPESLDTPRKLFERRIRYWETRPMPAEPHVIVSPADARMVAGSFERTSQLFLKEKFFGLDELLGGHKPEWRDAFADGDWAVFRLTPDKYHYNHVPVSGRVLDIHEIDGGCAPCNPGAVMALDGIYAKNRRVVTVIDTDVTGGTGAGLVAMVEIAALMIGDIVQAYSRVRYDDPMAVTPGLFLEKGQPKSLYRPGGSTDVLIFQKNRVRFRDDILSNLTRTDARTRFAEGFGRPLVETEVAAREAVAVVRESRGENNE